MQAQREKEREDIMIKQKLRQIPTVGQLFAKVDENLVSNTVNIDENEQSATTVSAGDNTSAITSETDSENVNKVNIEETLEPDSKIEEQPKAETQQQPVKKEKTSFLQNGGGIFPKIKLNRKFSKTKSKEKVVSPVVVATNNDNSLEQDLEKLDLNKIENKINTKKNPSEVWC